MVNPLSLLRTNRARRDTSWNSSGGIGAATCLALAANGVRVAVNGRRSEAVDAVRAAGGSALAVPADCTDAEAIGGACERVTAELGPVDIVCAFAGGGRPPQSLVLLADGEWRTDVEGNLTATFLTLKACLPVMIDRERGSVITMASGAARRPGGAPIAYAAAKAGIVKPHLDHWLLRDLLREDADARERLAALKRHNARDANRNMDVDVAAKATFVAELLTRARAERGFAPAADREPEIDVP